jgi:hypothetical protein
MRSDDRNRSHLPIPDRPRTGLITYDAKDGDQVPAHRAIAPAERRAQCPRHPDRRCWVWLGECFRRPVPDAERGAAGRGRAQVHALSHHGPVLAPAPGPPDWPQPPFGGHGGHHRDRQRLAGILLGPAQYRGTDCQDPQAQWLCHGAVRQMPRGAGVGDEPRRAVQCLAHGRRRLRVLLRLRRWRGSPMVPLAVRRDDADRGQDDARRGLPFHGRYD